MSNIFKSIGNIFGGDSKKESDQNKTTVAKTTDKISRPHADQTKMSKAGSSSMSSAKNAERPEAALRKKAAEESVAYTTGTPDIPSSFDTSRVTKAKTSAAAYDAEQKRHESSEIKKPRAADDMI